jgi:hypothetical protein
MPTLSEAQDMDVFFYYGEGDLELETLSDIYSGLIQPERSLFYNRQDGCGLSDKENRPLSFVLELSARYNIVKWIGYRNSQLPESNEIDRRVATSQSVIDFVKNDKGEFDVNFGYIPFADISQPKQQQLPLGI